MGARGKTEPAETFEQAERISKFSQERLGEFDSLVFERPLLSFVKVTEVLRIDQ